MPKTRKTMKRKTMKRKTMKKMWGGAKKKSKLKQQPYKAPMVGNLPKKQISMDQLTKSFGVLDVNPPPQPPPPPPPSPPPPSQVKDEMDILTTLMANVGTTSSRPSARIANVRLIFKPKPRKYVKKKTPYKNL